MRTDNIVEIATALREGILEHQRLHPDCESQREIEDYAISIVMRLGRGHLNPALLRDMIAVERSAYTGRVILEC